MIELILQAERALTACMVDQAERLYVKAVEQDPRNSIAVVGLARVALERGDDRAAYLLARRALEIDGENTAARRLVTRLSEVMAYRGEPVPDASPPVPATETAPAPEPAPAPVTEPPVRGPQVPTSVGPAPQPRRSLLGRLRGRG